jgi:NAD(P)-dependent dehydrogenase (short-subunit alcohol dehydrogenase family)
LAYSLQKFEKAVHMTSTSLTPSTALVTGATSGIGRATAIALAASGIHVAVAGRDKARGDQVVAAIRETGGRADFVSADLRDAASATQLARAAEGVLGHVDVLVNNAGSGVSGPTTDTTEAAFDELFALNVKAPYFLTAALASGMVTRGGGVIVNVSTMVAAFGLNGMALYGSTKAALELLTKAWAAEFGPQGIRVNAVAPGPVSTEGTEGMREAQGYLASLAPAKRLGTAEEIAAAIVYLASPGAGFTQGVVLPVDGGRVAV